jgi:hypothetical protein
MLSNKASCFNHFHQVRKHRGGMSGRYFLPASPELSELQALLCRPDVELYFIEAVSLVRKAKEG